ncbi:hypothetical protein Y1Q_0011033 [Alligator mississippiensis]|uniref:Uncharacterized protein n=1 Tax=Alligator mississippiensis TaxID=8496 RepID=A0A151N8F0_ALLMI|nr:hypothetical protein Y1Q_0011033 [Alligator mississippiensis]
MISITAWRHNVNFPRYTVPIPGSILAREHLSNTPLVLHVIGLRIRSKDSAPLQKFSHRLNRQQSSPGWTQVPPAGPAAD